MGIFGDANVSDQEKTAIKNIEVMIAELIKEINHWKKFKPRYEIEAREEHNLHCSPFGFCPPTYEQVCASWEHVGQMKILDKILTKIKKNCIKLCYQYISILKKAIKIIKKQKFESRKEKLNQKLEKLQHDFNSVFFDKLDKKGNTNLIQKVSNYYKGLVKQITFYNSLDNIKKMLLEEEPGADPKEIERSAEDIKEIRSEILIESQIKIRKDIERINVMKKLSENLISESEQIIKTL